MSMSNVSQTRGNIEKPFIRALFRMPKQLLFLLLHFGLRNHQAIYFFFMPTDTCQHVQWSLFHGYYDIVRNFSICERNVGNCITCTDISRITSTPAFSIFIRIDYSQNWMHQLKWKKIFFNVYLLRISLLMYLYLGQLLCEKKYYMLFWLFI